MGRARATGRRVWSDPVGRGGLIFVAANGSVGLSNFVFHVVLSRLLGPTQYGALGALLNVTAVLAVPLSAIQVTVAQGVVRRGEAAARETPPLGRLLRLAATAAAVAFAIWLGLTPTIDRFFHLHSPRATVAVGFWLVPAILASVLEGVLIGQQRFRVAGVGQLFGNGLSRLAAGVVLVSVGMGVTGGVAATAISAFVTLVIYSVALRGALTRGGVFAPRAGTALLSTVSLGGAALLTSIDAWLARHFLPPYGAGLFNAGATAGRIALFFPGAIALVYFPRLASSGGQGTEARSALARCAGLVGLLAFGAAGGLALFPHLSVDLLFGPAFSHASAVVGTIAFADAGIGLAGCFVYFQVARNSRLALAPWPTCVLALVLAAAFHGSMEVLALDMLAASGVLVLFLGGATAVAALRTLADDAASLPRQAILVEAPVVDVTLVVPFRNVGGPRLAAHLGDICQTLTASALSYEVIPVSDGSTDDSEQALQGLPAESVRPIVWADNRGKGEALRAGLAHGRGQYLGFIDGDGDIPARVLADYVALARSEQPDVVVGSKRHTDSKVWYPPARRLYSVGYQVLTTVLFGLRVRDTQTGVKLVRRDVLAEVLPRMVEKRFAFDLELLAVAHRLGYSHMAELPVTIGERFPSTISLTAVWRMLQDTLATFWRLRFLRFYDPPLVEEPAAHVEMAGTLAESLRRGHSLRILVCSWRDPAHTRAGGAEVYTHEVAKSWVSAGHQVTWFCSSVAGLPSYEVIDGIHMVRRGSRFSVYRRARLYYQRQGRGRFDLVVDEVNTRPFGASRWGAGTPVVALVFQLAREVWFHEVWWPIAAVGRFLLEPSWVRQLWRVPVFTISESSKRSLERLGIEDVTVVPPGTNAVARPRVTRESVPTVLFIGRLARNKRPFDAVDAFRLLRKRMPDAKLWVIGTGPLQRQLRRFAPDGVEFLGQVSETEKLERLARAHCLVSTSVREGWGLVVTEAAQVGTPAIAYDVDGLRDSVTASGGVLVAAKPTRLAEALKELLPKWSADAVPPVSAGGVLAWDRVGSLLLQRAAERADSRSRQVAVGEDVSSAWRKAIEPVATVCDRRAWSTAGIAALVALAPLTVVGSTVWEGRTAGIAIVCLALATVGALAESIRHPPLKRGPVLVHRDREGRQGGARFASPPVRGLVPAAVVGIVCIVAAQIWFAGGGAIAGGDVIPPVGTAWLAHLFSPWVYTGANMGAPGTYAMQLPWAVILAAVHLVGGSAALAERVWITVLFAGVGVSASALLTTLDFGPTPAIAGGLVYAFNAYVVAVVGFNSVDLLALAMIPLLIAWVLSAARARRLGPWLLALVPLAALLGMVTSNPPLLLACAVAVLGALVLVAWLHGRASFVSALRRTGAGIGVLAVTSAYWIVPYLVSILTTSSVTAASTRSWAWTEGRATLANGFWLNNVWGWTVPVYYPYETGFSRFPLAFLIYLLPVVAFAVLGLNGLERGRRGTASRVRLGAAASAVGLLVVLLSTGTRFPGSGLFNLLYALPLGWLLQEPGRFLFVTGLAYAVLIAIGMERLTPTAEGSTSPVVDAQWVRRRWRVAVLPLLGVVLLVTPAYPLFTGAIVPGPRSSFPSDHVTVPQYWLSMATDINTRAPAGNVLMLPVDDFYQMPYTWYYGSDGFISDLLSPNTVNPNPVGLGYGSLSAQVLTAAGQLQDAILSHDWALTTDLASTLGTRDLLVREDIESGFTGRTIASPTALASALAADPAVRLESRRGPLELFAFRRPLVVPDAVVTVQARIPDLDVLGAMSAGTALVTSSPLPGTPDLIPVPSPSSWPKVGNVRVDTVSLPGADKPVLLMGTSSISVQGSASIGLLDAVVTRGASSTQIRMSLPAGHETASLAPAAIEGMPTSHQKVSLLTGWTSYSAQWHGPAGSDHVMVDGMLNGWISSTPAKAAPTYGPSGLVHGAALLSLLAFLALAVGLGSSLIVGRRRPEQALVNGVWHPTSEGSTANRVRQRVP